MRTQFMSGSGSQHGGAHIAAAAAGISSAFGGGAAPVSAPQPQAVPAQQYPAYHHQQPQQQTQQRYPYPAADGYNPYYAPPSPYYYPPAPAYYPFQHNPFAPFYNPRTSVSTQLLLYHISSNSFLCIKLQTQIACSSCKSKAVSEFIGNIF
jgi:hypothetical protein